MSPDRLLPFALVTAAAALIALPGRAASAGDLDAPLGLGTEGPVRVLFLDMTAADARIASRPSASVTWQASNSWSSPTTFARGSEVAHAQLDAQSDAVSIALSAPWAALWRGGAERGGTLGSVVRRLTTSVEGRVTLWSGGWSDGPVEAWHKAFGFTNFERQEYARNKVRLFYGTLGGPSAFEASRARWAFGHVVVRNQLLIARGGTSARSDSTGERPRWAVSLRLDTKLPVGSSSSLAGSGGTDVGVGVLATAEVTPWLVLHANAFTSAWSHLGGGVVLQPRRFHHGGELSAVLAGRRWALIVEDRLLSPVLPNDWRSVGTSVPADLAASAAFALTRAHNQISVGVRRGMVTAWFSEDFTPSQGLPANRWFFDSNAPDISVGVRIAHSL